MGRLRNWAPVAGALVIILLVGLALAYIGEVRSSEDNDLWSRYSAAGVGLAVTVVAGLLVTVALRVIDAARARDEELRRLFLELIKAYNMTKGARRQLRAMGLTSPGLGRHVSEKLSTDDAKELRSCLRELNEAQLAFEQVERDAGQSRLFSASTLEQVTSIESYLGRVVVKSWERHGHRLREGQPVSVVDALQLHDFVVSQSADFDRHVSGPIRTITTELNRRMYGRRGFGGGSRATE